MIHEVLLALSGHPSPLFDASAEEAFPLVTAAEADLLDSLGKTASIHRALRSHLARIIEHHPSTLCRALGSSLLRTHLARFQKAILAIEESILAQDAAIVGAYNIIPLASIVAHFEPWGRRMEWYWDLACFMLSYDAPFPTTDETLLDVSCTGKGILDKLREECRTGYPDIEQVALELTRVAERAWTRHLSAWLMQQELPAQSSTDFFIQSADRGSSAFLVNHALIPSFLSIDTAESILFIGRMLSHLLHNTSTSSQITTARTNSLFEARYIHLDNLASLSLPISKVPLASLIIQMRVDISRKLTEELLPSQEIWKTLCQIKAFCLGDRDDFMDTLIAEADRYVHSRNLQTRKTPEHASGDILAGLMLKQGDLNIIMGRIWSSLSLSLERGHPLADDLEWGPEHLFLTIRSQASRKIENSSRPSLKTETLRSTANTFNDLLLSTPTSLAFQLDATFELLFDKADLQVYSAIHSYLLGIRRAHVHLTELWRRDSMRRSRRSGNRASLRNLGRREKLLVDARSADLGRDQAMRKTWAACSMAVFFLAELGDYFTKEVIAQSWDAFDLWASQSTPKAATPASLGQSSHEKAYSPLHDPEEVIRHAARAARDPESLAHGHRLFLKSLMKGLLMADKSFTKTLRVFLGHVDQLTAQVDRLQVAQRSLDLQNEGVVETASANFAQEESETYIKMNAINGYITQDIKLAISRLTEIDNQPLSKTHRADNPLSRIEFVPWNSNCLDRLLMRLDFGVLHDQRS